MMLYAARIWKDKQWHVVRFYDTYEAAEFFASSMLSKSEWDVKAMTLESANQVGA
jgi:hypothetical protein